MTNKDDRREIDLLEFWRIIRKRKWVIFTFSSALVLFTGVFTFLATPQYKSTAKLLIEDEASKMLDMDETFGSRAQFEDLRFFNTQLELLKSKSLAERVVEKMNLLSRPEFTAGAKTNKSFFDSLKNSMNFNWIAPKKESENEEAGFSVPPNPYSRIAEKITKVTKVKPIRETKLVEVSVTSSSPILATEIVNTLSEEFINFSVEKRFEITLKASDFLSKQISSLREDLATKEGELQRYGREKGLFYLKDETESEQLNKFASLNDAYTQAQLGRIKSEAIYLEFQSLNLDSFPQFVNNPVIQKLVTDYTKMKNDYKEKNKVFKSGYPEMIKLQARLESMERELKNEIRKAVDTAKTEYQSALKEEQELKKLLERQKEEVVEMNSNAILYNSLKMEAENIQKTLNSLFERQNDIAVSARLSGLSMSHISIIDKAEVPTTPFSPKKKINIILALVLGLFGGIGLCFFLEYLDNTIKSPEDIEKIANVPSIGVIPYLPKNGKMNNRRYKKHGEEYTERNDSSVNRKEIELINHHYPEFFISEDYRTVRTSILLSRAENPPKTLVFSSSLPEEGKSVSVANMAVAFSQLEKEVLVIDADLRKPRLHDIFKVRNVVGLSAFLTGMALFKDAIQKTSIENIWILPSGLIPPHPAELLNSNKMKEMMEFVKQKFDVTLIDLPPILAVSDAVIVSSQADATVLVLKTGKTTQKQFLNAVEEMRRSKADIIGVLFNEMKMEGNIGEYRDYYLYQRYAFKGQEAQKKTS